MDFFEFPSISQVVSSTAPAGIEFFNALSPILWLTIGIVIGTIALLFIRELVIWAINTVSYYMIDKDTRAYIQFSEHMRKGGNAEAWFSANPKKVNAVRPTYEYYNKHTGGW